MIRELSKLVNHTRRAFPHQALAPGDLSLAVHRSISTMSSSDRQSLLLTAALLLVSTGTATGAGAQTNPCTLITPVELRLVRLPARERGIVDSADATVCRRGDVRKRRMLVEKVYPTLNPDMVQRMRTRSQKGETLNHSSRRPSAASCREFPESDGNISCNTRQKPDCDGGKAISCLPPAIISLTPTMPWRMPIFSPTVACLFELHRAWCMDVSVVSSHPFRHCSSLRSGSANGGSQVRCRSLRRAWLRLHSSPSWWRRVFPLTTGD